MAFGSLLQRLLEALRLRRREVPPPVDPVEFFDLDLAISEYQRLENGHQLARVHGKHVGMSIGLEVELHAVWEPQIIQESLVVYWGKATYRSIGAESDALLATLAAGYGISNFKGRFVDSLQLLAVSLGSDPRLLPERPAKMKFFFDNGVPDDYAEIFTNLDLGQGVAELHEKDPEYRAPLLRALTSHLTAKPGVA